MAGNQLPPPALFLPNPGNPPVPLRRWFKSFQTYLVACGLDDKSVSDAHRRAILLDCLGSAYFPRSMKAPVRTKNLQLLSNNSSGQT